MAVRSAGLLLYRTPPDGGVEVLLVHPGGPYWADRDEGAWSVPKGEYGPDEEPLEAARREFGEELGAAAPDGPALALGSIRQKGGKEVVAWALRGDLDPATLDSNTVEIEWPPRSGRWQTYPEVDRATWCGPRQARRLLNPAQAPFVDRLLEQLGDARVTPG